MDESACVRVHERETLLMWYLMWLYIYIYILMWYLMWSWAAKATARKATESEAITAVMS